jgi:hypothetical protein
MKCTCCSQEKNSTDFSERQRKCKGCRNEIELQKYWKDRKRKKTTRYVENNRKTCSKCLNNKEVFLFNKGPSCGRLQSICRECQKINNKKYYELRKSNSRGLGL